MQGLEEPGAGDLRPIDTLQPSSFPETCRPWAAFAARSQLLQQPWGMLSAEAQPQGSVRQSRGEKPEAPRGTAAAHPCWELCPPAVGSPSCQVACPSQSRASVGEETQRGCSGEAGLRGSESQAGPGAAVLAPPSPASPLKPREGQPSHLGFAMWAKQVPNC